MLDSRFPATIVFFSLLKARSVPMLIIVHGSCRGHKLSTFLRRKNSRVSTNMPKKIGSVGLLIMKCKTFRKLKNVILNSNFATITFFSDLSILLKIFKGR